ncbi:MAG: RNA polymerase sigma factor [Armatimonadota bacterium]
MRDQTAEISIVHGAGVLVDGTDNAELTFDELYDEYAAPLFRYACALTCSCEDAEDAVQEVFVCVARKWSRFSRVGNAKAYLFRATRNAAFDVLRTRQRMDKLSETALAEFLNEISDEVADLPVEAAALCEALARLPVDQREVLVLKVFNEMTFKEIADTVHASLNTVASRYRYAVDKMRKTLEVREDG